MNPGRAHAVLSRELDPAGTGLHGIDAGPLDGEPVLLLHGFPDDGSVWAPVVASLAHRHRTIAPDLRGFNRSAKPEGVEAYRIDCLVDDVRRLVDAVGGRCHLVGHDWGGLLAWSFAARHPERVDRLAILNAPHPRLFARALRDDPAQRAASAYVLRLCAPGAEARLAENHFERLWNVVRETGGQRRERVEAWSQPGALTAMLHWYRALDIERAWSAAGVDALPSLGDASGRIAAPTLVLWGERDGSFAPSCLEGLADWVPDLRLERIAEGGHWLQLEQPERIAARLLAFFERKD